LILDKFKLDDKVALVTGASAGLGQAIASPSPKPALMWLAQRNTRAADATCEAVARLIERRSLSPAI